MGRRAPRTSGAPASCASAAAARTVSPRPPESGCSIPKTVPEDLSVKDMHLVGNYGVGIHFSDNHTTGIFRFRELKRAR